MMRKFCSNEPWTLPSNHHHHQPGAEQLRQSPGTAGGPTSAAGINKKQPIAGGPLPHCPPNYYITDRQLAPAASDSTLRRPPPDVPLQGMGGGGDSDRYPIYETIDSDG